MTSAGAVRSERGSQATFRAGVDLVTFAVTAVDRTGNPVADLTADDFEIVEDGRPRVSSTSHEGRRKVSAQDGAWRKVEFKVKRPDVKLRSRKGYFAPYKEIK